jgi:uncharacterized OsmC-like protein
MTTAVIANAMQRARTIFSRRPQAAMHPDDPAIAAWQQDLQVLSRHANGTAIATDMPAELGGQGIQVTPGWLLRAALASCLATRIAMEAAARGIDLSRLEVVASSTTDARGLLGMADEGGAPAPPGPLDVQLQVRLGAASASAESLRALAEDSQRCSPVSAALRGAIPVTLRIDIDRG